MLSKIKYILFLTLIAALAGCQTSRIAMPQMDIPVPETYTGSHDTTNIADIKWKDFFKDEELEKLITIALENNPDLTIALQRIEMARAGMLAAQGARQPIVDGDIGVGGRKFGDYTMDGVGNWDTNFSENIDDKQRIPTNFLPDFKVGFRSSWEVDLWGKLRSMKKAAYHRFIASEQGRKLIITSLISEVAREYYRLLALDSELAIMRYNIDLQTKATEAVMLLKEAGRANELAVNQFTAQLLNSKGAVVNITSAIIDTENRINTLLGRFAQPIPRGTPLRLRDYPEKIAAGIPIQLLNNRPDILQAKSEILASHSELQAADLAFLPSLTLNADLGLHAFKGHLLFNPGSLAYGILGGLSAPLLNRKGLKANRAHRLAELQEALTYYQKLVVTGYNEIVSELMRIENLQEMAKLKEEEVIKLREAVAVSNELFLVGAANYLEVVTAQNSVVAAEFDLIEIREQEFLALLQLYRALGGGWE